MADQQSQEVFGAPQSVEDVSDSGQNLTPNLNVESYEPPPVDPSGGGVPPPPSGGFNFRIVFIILIGLLILGGVYWGISTFLNDGNGNTKGEIAIKYWGLWEPEEVMQTVIDDFERQNPGVHIVYEQNSPIQYRERLQAAIERGEGPDIFRFHSTWKPMLKNDLTAIPSDIYTSDQALATFYASAVSESSLDSKLMGIPIGIDTLLLFYNADQLNNAGIDAPRTWTEFNQAATTLTSKDDSGRIEHAGAAIGTAENVEHFSDILGLIMYQNGVDFTDLSSAEASQSLEFYTLFALEPANVWDDSMDNSIIAFAGGDVSMIFAPSWQAHAIRALNPNLNFATAPVPQLAGGDPTTWGTYWIEGVSTKSEHKDIAFQFLKYLSEKDTMTKLFAEASKDESRLFGEPYSRSDLTDQLLENDYLSPVGSQAPFMKSWYLSSRTQDNGINDKIIGYFKDAVNAVVQGSGPQPAMETAASGVRQVLTEYDAN